MKCQILNSNETHLVLPMDMEIINFHVREKNSKGTTPIFFHATTEHSLYKIQHNVMPVSSLKMLMAS